MRKAHGVFFIDGKEEGESIQCCHCNGHFNLRPGSGVTRGFCMLCMRVTCGQKKCNACYPFEKKLEDYRSGKLKILR